MSIGREGIIVNSLISGYINLRSVSNNTKVERKGSDQEVVASVIL